MRKKLPLDAETIATVIKTVADSEPFPLSFVSHLVFHALRDAAKQRETESRCLVAFFAETEYCLETSDAAGFAFFDTMEYEQIVCLFWFRGGAGCPKSSDQLDFVQESIKEMFQVAKELLLVAPSPECTEYLYFNGVDSSYINLIKEVCSLKQECLPHHAHIFSDDFISSLNVTTLSPGTRFVVGDEAFLLDQIRKFDIDTIADYNKKYAQYRPYIEKVILDPVLAPFHRIVRALPSLDAAVPKDVSKLRPCSWCLVHYGLSIGMNWTMPDFRRRRLAYVCTAAVTKAYSDYISSEPVRSVLEESLGLKVAGLGALRPHCYTQLENVSSRKVYSKIGYHAWNEFAVDWIVAKLKGDS